MCFLSLKRAACFLLGLWLRLWLLVYLLFCPSDRVAAALFSSSVMFCSVNEDTSEILHFSITTISISAKHKHNTKSITAKLDFGIVYVRCQPWKIPASNWSKMSKVMIMIICQWTFISKRETTWLHLITFRIEPNNPSHKGMFSRTLL